jgi:hypothetical protein
MSTATMTKPTKTAKPPGDRSKLATVAAIMYSHVTKPKDWDRAKLANGLDIILQRVDEHQWRLAMARESVYPSDIEVEIVRSTFDVPEAAEEARSEKTYTHPKTHRLINYRRVEITWQER